MTRRNRQCVCHAASSSALPTDLSNATCAGEQSTLLLLFLARLIHTVHDLGRHLCAIGRVDQLLDGQGKVFLPLRVHMLEEAGHESMISTLMDLLLVCGGERVEPTSGIGLIETHTHTHTHTHTQ